MNPLVIKFKSIKNIPLESLKKAKIEKIYIKYKILNEPFIETETWDVKNESMSVDHVKIIPTDKMNALELLEYLQTSYLLVAILGMKDGDKQSIHKKSETETVVKVKGKKSASSQNLEKIPLENQKHKTLALAKCDLSNLLDKQAFLEEELPLFSNESFSIKLMRKLEVMIQHLDDMNDEIILNLSSTEIFLSFAVPLQENQGTLTLAGKMHYNRLYVTFHDCSIAQTVVKRVKSLNLRSILKTQKSGTQHNEMPKEDQKFLTGFLVHDTKDVLLYVEGIYSIISSFYEELLQLPQCSQDIIFDGSLVFNKRLYDKFIMTGGFHSLNLKNTLEKLLYIEESVKKGEQVRPWKETIRSLSEIMKTEDMKRACREELFPTPTELISLDIKYGVPQRIV
ncbi:uncharacterized protein LOC124164860 [Ischnura elegans]|uniref:uncharacterized protein LOC124164860 n=1 Tax=Ischnura elegans TaxID=197161 RepID=UPI001ED884D6|nr:uncharacterized protein LOC124164860 [Ischnura elegans]